MTERKHEFNIISSVTGFFACLLTALLLIEPTNVLAAEKVKFKYINLITSETVTYNNVVPKYYINGELFKTGSYKPIVISKYAMAPVSVFSEGCNVDYEYDSDYDELIFTGYGHTVVMTLGSTAAFVDGRSVELPTAPIRIKYKSSKKTTIVVPSQILSKYLGISYEWIEASASVQIKLPIRLVSNGEDIYYTADVAGVSYNGKTLDTAKTPSYVISDNAMICINTVEKGIPGLDYQYSKDIGEIKISYGDVTLKMYLNRRLVYINGVMSISTAVPMKILNTETGLERIYVPGRYVFETLGFKYTWVSGTRISKIESTDKTGSFEFSFDDSIIFDAPGGVENNIEPLDIASASSSELHDYYQVFTLPVMEGIKTNDIVITNDIYNHRVTLDLAGNYLDFYRKTGIKTNGTAVVQVQVLYYEPDDFTRINIYTQTNNNGVVLDYKCRVESDEIVFIFDRPKAMYDKIIVLDAGHGGSDPGASYGGTNEKDLNFSIIYNYCKKLFDVSNIKVYYSRWNDTLPSLNERARIGRCVEADFFISLHHNAAPSNTSWSGTEVYYSVFNPNNFKNLTNQKMAQVLIDNICDSIGSKKNGAKEANFTVISPANKIPAVLIEVGYMTNSEELKKAKTKKQQKAVAQAIYDSVMEFYEFVK